jgi:hypothetical protein
MPMDFNKIITELCWRLENGTPDFSNPEHLQELKVVLTMHKWDAPAINELIETLTEANYVNNAQNRKLGRVGKKWGSSPGDAPKKTKDEPEGEKPVDREKEPEDDKKSDGKPQKRIELTKSDIKKQKYNDQQLAKVIENGLIPTEDSGAKGGVGSFALTKEQLQKTQDFLEKRAEDPNYKLDIPEYDVSESDIDTSIDTLKEELGPAFAKFKTKIQKAGGVNPALTKGEAGEQRFRNVIRQYLRYGGRSVITGEFVNFSDMQLDHRVPYSSAEQRSEENGTTILEEQRKMDSPENWDMVEANVNQLKSSLSDSEFLESINKKLAQSPGDKEAKKIKQEFKNKRRSQLKKYHNDRIKNKDFSEFSEDKINKMDLDERNTLMKAWNYYHPSTKTFNEELKKDPDYAKKLEKAGIKIVYDEKKKSKTNPLGFVDNEGGSAYTMTRLPNSGGARSRGKRRSKADEIEHIKEKTQASGKFKWETAEETNTQNKILDELRESIRKEREDVSKKAKALKNK